MVFLISSCSLPKLFFFIRSHKRHKKMEQSCDYAFCETSGVSSTPF
uniref:Uncharacterized protein n=1 Tax=Echinococcus granulosus TaxID=6210 RepID=A0A068WJV6_ECHGR|nr:hypothetical protein EgrG_000258100 [Echinococcus granulosus]